MNDKIKKIFARLTGDKKTTLAVFAVLALTVFGTALMGKAALNRLNLQASVASRPPSLAASGVAGAASMENFSASSAAPDVATAGIAIVTDTEALGSSWPGKIISLGNIPVQPRREGTLIEWRVKIGERVSAGQTLGKLSAPPVMPELVAMLAEKTEMLARARAQAATTEIFTEKTITRLKTLLVSFSSAPDQGAITAQKQNLRALIEQTLIRHGGTISNVTNPAFFQYGSLNRQYGPLDQSNQNAYELAFMRLAAALREPAALPFDGAREYFAAAVRLANTTPESSEIMSIKMMMRDDQEKFLTMFAEIAMKETEYGTMSQEINEKIADNERMLAMARADALAAEAAYATVERGINGSLFITAPRAGTISAITKNVGEFVGPGMPIASLNADDMSERFVRFSIPSNIKLPTVGETLSIVRPGFSRDIRQVKVIGIGTSLDVAGAYMADATFFTPADWPVEASVRVLAPPSSKHPIIGFSSVLWGEEGAPFVWGVSEAGRIFAKKITIGRTLGTSVEIYEGLENGDRYIIGPTADIREDMLLSDIAKTAAEKDGAAPATLETASDGGRATTIPAKSGGHEGHQM